MLASGSGRLGAGPGGRRGQGWGWTGPPGSWEGAWAQECPPWGYGTCGGLYGELSTARRGRSSGRGGGRPQTPRTGRPPAYIRNLSVSGRKAGSGRLGDPQLALCGKLRRDRAKAGGEGLWAAGRPRPGWAETTEPLFVVSWSRFPLGSTMALMTGKRKEAGRQQSFLPPRPPWGSPSTVPWDPRVWPHSPSSCFCTRRSSFRMELISYKCGGRAVEQARRATTRPALPGSGSLGIPAGASSPALSLPRGRAEPVCPHVSPHVCPRRHQPHLIGRLQDGHLVLGVDLGFQVLPRTPRVLEKDPVPRGGGGSSRGR